MKNNQKINNNTHVDNINNTSYTGHTIFFGGVAQANDKCLCGVGLALVFDVVV